jgi:hypothetical protein
MLVSGRRFALTPQIADLLQQWRGYLIDHYRSAEKNQRAVDSGLQFTPLHSFDGSQARVEMFFGGCNGLIALIRPALHLFPVIFLHERRQFVHAQGRYMTDTPASSACTPQ